MVPEISGETLPNHVNPVPKMSDAEWDNDDFEPRGFRAPVSDKWEGEDEEDDVKDNWEDEDDEKEKPVEITISTGGITISDDVRAFQKKKKRPIAEIIAEKEAQKEKELQEEKEKEVEDKRVKSPNEQAAEKLRQKKLQEESDLKLAKEAFGLSDNGEAVIDKMHPEGEEDFLKFEQALKDKITTYEKSPHYAAFLDKLFTDLVINVESEDVRKLSATLNSMYHEKLRQQKETEKKKKKKNKASLKVTRNDDLTDLGYDDFAEDFM